MSAARTASPDALHAVDIFCQALAAWNIELTAVQRSSYAAYAEMLVDWNANRFNLTRLVTPEQIALNHFLDSVVLSQLVKVPAGACLIDIGTGAGFPGLAFKLLRRDIQLVLIESTAKKLTFCRAVADEVGLSDVQFVHGRAESPEVIRRFGGQAAVVTARALAPLKTLLQWTVPFAAPNGVIVAWKGSRAAEEVADASAAAEHLRMALSTVERTLTLPGYASLEHAYVICKSR